jgi:hypothetical protein
MALKAKLDEGELALLEILEDPVYLSEFLRSTNNGSLERNTWSPEPFEARWYQRMLLTDKTENILLMGGRSIGKCQPRRSKIYTTEGYKSIQMLRNLPSFSLYALDEQNNFVIRRASITRDKQVPIYKITLDTGEVIECTGNHPILTDHGYVWAEKLNKDDKVITVRRLPSLHCVQTTLTWAEARILGYIWGNQDHKTRRTRTIFTPRFKQIKEEMHHIASEMFIEVKPKYDDTPNDLIFRRKRGTGMRVQLTTLLYELKLLDKTTRRRVAHLAWLKSHSLETIQTFLEAYLAQWGKLFRDSVSFTVLGRLQAKDFKELFSHFGIEMEAIEIKERGEWKRGMYDNSLWTLQTKSAYDARLIWRQFKIPGVSIGEFKDLAPSYEVITDNLRYSYITDITIGKIEPTFAVHVYQHENYISEGIVTHNSVILEDLNIYKIVNTDIEFSKTHEHLLATPNTNQLTPILDKIINRMRGSDLLSPFVEQINKSKGTLDFNLYGLKHRMYARIAGSNNEANLVGLHLPFAMIDEIQLFPESAFNQLMPAINRWEAGSQVIGAGVSNGNRSSVLYKLDQRAAEYKKYRIPAPNNPYYSFDMFSDDIMKYRGEDSDEFQRLVLGRHGSATFVLITADMIGKEPFDFYSFKYSANHKAQGKRYKEVLQTPKFQIPNNISILAIDCGFADPTIIQLFVMHGQQWRLVCRWRLTRIDFTEQEQIIDWIATHYNVSRIAIDTGAGGGGSGMLHSFLNRQEYANKQYAERILPVSFGEKLIVGYNKNEEPMETITKVFASNELVRLVQNKEVIISEVDHEGASQLERIAKQRTPAGNDRFYIMTERGAVSDDDHIYSSFICFVMATIQPITSNRKPGTIAKSATLVSNK